MLAAAKEVVIGIIRVSDAAAPELKGSAPVSEVAAPDAVGRVKVTEPLGRAVPVVESIAEIVRVLPPQPL